MICATHLFLDFDDTLTPMQEHRQRYIVTMARLLSNRYGGQVDTWEQAVRSALEASIRRYTERFVGPSTEGFREWLKEEQRRQAWDVCVKAGIPAALEFDLKEQGIALQHLALRMCSTPYPGTAEALQALTGRGMRIHMASAWDAGYLSAALEGMGLAEYVCYRFGPDLVDCAKEGPEFYRRAFHACGIEPEDAIVVDDQPTCLDWAAAVGAHPVQARFNGQPQMLEAAVERMDELPGVVARIGC